MIRGFYSAASGMLTNSKKLDVAGTNMANASTSGYKNDRVVSTSFSDQMVYKNDKSAVQNTAGLGIISNGQSIAGVYTSFVQGNLKQTENPSHLAIGGQGFFTIQDNSGQTKYTRSGEYILDDNGYIVNPSGAKLMGENGPINTGGRNFDVTADGRVYVAGNLMDTLKIYNPADVNTMQKSGEGMFIDTGNAQAQFTGVIKQGFLEQSNADLTRQMMEMMTNQRGFQSCSQILKMIDSTLEKSVTLGRKG